MGWGAATSTANFAGINDVDDAESAAGNDAHFIFRINTSTGEIEIRDSSGGPIYEDDHSEWVDDIGVNFDKR